MQVSLKRLAGITAILLLSLGPWIVGAAAGDGWPILLILLAGLSLRGLHSPSSRWKGISVLIISVALTITSADLVMRPLLKKALYIQPNLEYLDQWSPMPLIRRYRPHHHWAGTRYGNIASSWNARKYREYRYVDFAVDGNGYRNTLPEGDRPRFPLDVIVLGDSFGEGSGTTQDQIGAAYLASRYHLRTYNLSSSGNSPWQEYATLAVNLENLPIRKGTTVIWALYTGNDLDDSYQSIWDPEKFPWRGPVSQLWIRLDNWRGRSPIHQLFDRVMHAHNSHAGAAPNPQYLPSNTPAGEMVDGNPLRELPDGKTFLFLGDETEHSFRTYEQVRLHPNYVRLAKTVQAMKILANRNGIRAAVVLIPTSGEVYSWLLKGERPWSSSKAPGGFSLALSQICRQQAIPFFDIKPDLIDESRRLYESSGDLLWWRDDSHFNPHGHQALAAFVHDKVLPSLRQ